MQISIEEAIKAMELDKTCDFEGDQQILEAALQLGIEALEKLKKSRHYKLPSSAILLPGEKSETT